MIVNLKNDINRDYMTKYNFTKSTGKTNKYIAIHYVGAEGSALGNCKYFQQKLPPEKSSSAHVFVDHSGKLYQSVEFHDIAWHVGSKNGFKHNEARNTNSIGIEMCCKKDSDGRWYFTQDTIDSAVALTATLMLQYDIPLANVIRHHDVTGKICPEPYVRDKTAWTNFKKKVNEAYNRLVGSYVTIKIVALRDKNLNYVTDFNSLSNAVKEKCVQEKNKVNVKKGSMFKIVNIKQDATDGNIWGVTKSGYIIPIEYNKGIKAVKL